MSGGSGPSQLTHKGFKWEFKKNGGVLLLDACPVSATSLACFLCVLIVCHTGCVWVTTSQGGCC